MKNIWITKESKKYINFYKKKKIGTDLALRIYTTHLLGKERKLVLYGGGNTSCKSSFKDIYGNAIDVIYVKGSGWDMSNLNEKGMPALELNPLLKTLKLKSLSDAKMVNYLRKNLINSTSPNPSVETLLHSFLPHRYIDHTHSSAILSLVNQPNSKNLCKKIFGKKLGIVDYIMPGFDLAKKAKLEFDKDKKVEGLLLLNHGIFTFGENAKQSYDRMIKFVSKAEKYIKQRKSLKIKYKKNLLKIEPNKILAELRSSLYGITNKKWILSFYTTREVMDFTSRKDLEKIINNGPVTPDHVIRIKPFFLILKKHNQKSFSIEKQINKFSSNYLKYFSKYKKEIKGAVMSDSVPRIIILPGVGFFSVGHDYKNSKIAKDIFLSMIESIKDALKIGKFKSISRREIFKMEYWPLERAKLSNIKTLDLTGNSVVITGGCGTIGLATAEEFIKEGAEVVLIDNNKKNIDNLPNHIRNRCFYVKCDVTNPFQVKKAIKKINLIFGGVDILISNAGRAFEGKIAEVETKLVKESFEINFFSHQYFSQQVVKIFKKQKFGGVVLFNISKQSVNPGYNFGPYGLPKSSTLFLMKQYALEYGKYNIRFNGINADRIKSGLLTEKMILKRSKSRKLSRKNYMKGNLLQTEITAKDVAKAFVMQAKLTKTTGNIITVDGGNIEASLR